jgi:hypothetical protein
LSLILNPDFWKDGTFKAVDNQGMAVKGKYTLMKSAITILQSARKKFYGP